MKVIGTAGHIDHGKSTLVERLTGIDPDRLGEEKRRGMTIDLGFAWMTLPSGREVSIVDVPGHERFIKNMLAGAAGIDVALLVVAADEGVMPQTREHLDILDLLGVSTGVVALTKADLVDEEWLVLVRDDVEEALRPTGLAGSAIIPVSARTGAGIDDLVAALDATIPDGSRQDEQGVAYLPVDRVFTISGFGTVVTGTLHGGELATGQEVEILPEGRRARIRGMQSHRRAAERAGPGTRVALNLAPVSHDEIQRGAVVTLPGTMRVTRRFAGRIRALPHLDGGLAHWLQVAVHLGAAELAGRVSVLSAERIEAGDTGWAVIALETPVAAIRGQHFVLRLPAPLGTVAGGSVVDVMPRYRRRDSSVVDRLTRLADRDDSVALAALLSGSRPRTPASLAQALGISLTQVGQLLERAGERGKSVELGGWYVDEESWRGIRQQAISVVEEYQARNPLEPGMPREELRRRLGLGAQAGAAALLRLVKTGSLSAHGPIISLPGRERESAVPAAEADRILGVLAQEQYSPPSGSELLERAATSRPVLEALAREGRIVKVAEGLYFERSIYDRLVGDVLAAIEREGKITVAALRDRYGTSRKYALALLEHLDDERITRRVGDRRVLGSRRPACA